jgi:GAF domain-containing protein/HAMP domain-containing protein
MENFSEETGYPERSVNWLLSLRTRLILSYVIITFIAIIGMGYYIYLRTLQSNSLVSKQLDASDRQQALANLTQVSSEQANNLNNFFISIKNAMTTAGTTATYLLSNESLYDNGSNWDATKSLARLTNGSWDNPNTDSVSIFIPAKRDLTPPVISELNSLKQMDIVSPSILQNIPEVSAVYYGGLDGETLYYPNIDLASIVPPDFDVTQRPWFVDAVPLQNPDHKAVWSDPYLDAAANGLIVTNSFPVFDATRNFRGVIAMDVKLSKITDVVSTIKVGQTGYALLIDKNFKLIAIAERGYRDLGISSQSLALGHVLEPSTLSPQLPTTFFKILNNMGKGQTGLEEITIGGVDRFIVYHPISDVGYSLALIVPAQEWLTGASAAKEQISESTTNTLQSSFVLVAFILMLAILAAIWIGNTLTSPLVALTQTAEEITDGNLNAEAEVRRADEIGILSKTLNTMTSTLRDSIQSLEQRVKERTYALEIASGNASRRATQFEAITQVTRAISSIRNMDELMPLVASVISKHFGFYHVGIFLNDENAQNAFLIASNSEGGRRMLERHHSLKIGAQGIVGYVASRGEPRVARNVGEDFAFFNNPDLPETKSEAAIPLRSGNVIIGVLDVQSTKEDAFSQEEIDILSILADQVSLSIENTRLFETTRRSLIEAETLYRQYLHEGWDRLPQEEQVTGFRFTPRGASPFQSPAIQDSQLNRGEKDNGIGNAPYVVPIKLHGETIGNLIVKSPEGAEWNQDQVDLVNAVAERVALSAENARLFDETTRRAERERLVTEITSKIRSTNDPEEMIRTALEELRNALGATQIQLIPQVVPAYQSSESGDLSSVEKDSVHKGQRGNGAKK